MLSHRDVAGGGGYWCGLPPSQPKGQQNKNFNQGQINFLLSTMFEILSQIKGNSIRNWNTFNVQNFPKFTRTLLMVTNTRNIPYFLEDACFYP
jgi:hypothetical protein